MSRFDYVKYDEQAITEQNDFKELCARLETKIESLGYSLGPDAHAKVARAKATAITKLEELYMWVGKAIRDDQIQRNVRDGVKTSLQEERKNG